MTREGLYKNFIPFLLTFNLREGIVKMMLLMEEILHHQGCIKPYGYIQLDKPPINWCRMSSINSTICAVKVKDGSFLGSLMFTFVTFVTLHGSFALGAVEVYCCCRNETTPGGVTR